MKKKSIIFHDGSGYINSPTAAKKYIHTESMREQSDSSTVVQVGNVSAGAFIIKMDF